MSRADLPRSFLVRLANLCSMPVDDMAMILNRLAADGYMTRVRKGESYLLANLPEPAPDRPAPPIARAVANAQDRIRQRRADPPPQTMTAAAVPAAARRLMNTGRDTGRHRRTSGGAPPVKQVLEQMRRQREQRPDQDGG